MLIVVTACPDCPDCSIDTFSACSTLEALSTLEVLLKSWESFIIGLAGLNGGGGLRGGGGATNWGRGRSPSCPSSPSDSKLTLPGDSKPVDEGECSDSVEKKRKKRENTSYFCVIFVLFHFSELDK